MNGNADLWVFGYGSLVWRPGFEFLESALARAHGYHRSLCIYSHVHRGTRARPGLVLGLDRGGSCLGLAFRVAAARRAETVRYLRAREQVTSVYVEKTLSLRLSNGASVRALAYVADRAHEQYAGRLTPVEAAAVVAAAVGASGDNPSYVLSTYEHLARLAIRDQALAEVARRLESFERAPLTAS